MSTRNGYVQWGWADIEEMLQCPVCLDKPAANTTVPQCQNGHHICSACKAQVSICPICKSPFLGTRNYVVEELINHYDILRNTMLLNNITENTLEVKKKKKRKHRKLPVFAVDVISRKKFNTPNATKGNYPCRVVGCDMILNLARMLNHTRSFHEDVLTESEVDENGEYRTTLTIAVNNKQAIDTQSFVFFVRGMGSIYLTTQTLRTGYFLAFLQMSTCLSAAKKILATLQFKSSQSNISIVYKQQLLSVRDCIKGMMERKQCCILDQRQFKAICVENTFKCTLSLSKFNSDSDTVSSPNKLLIDTVTAVRNSLISYEQEKTMKDSKAISVNSGGYCNGTKPKPNSCIRTKQPNGDVNAQAQTSQPQINIATKNDNKNANKKRNRKRN